MMLVGEVHVQGTGGWKHEFRRNIKITTTYLSLILDRSDSIFRRPIDRGGCGVNNCLGGKSVVDVLGTLEVFIGVLETRVLGCKLLP